MLTTCNKCSLLQGNSYVKIPEKLKNSMKQLINISNNENKCFR